MAHNGHGRRAEATCEVGGIAALQGRAIWRRKGAASGGIAASDEGI